MADTKRANRQVCDVDIYILKTMAPYLYFDTANTTSTSISGDSTYAMAKGSKRIAFQNPMEGTLTIEAQVYPFKFFALLSDGAIETDAAYAVHEEVVADAEGSITLPAVKNGEIITGTVYVYPKGSYGEESEVIEGSFSSSKFTATESSKIVKDAAYEVAYMVNRTGVKKISFTNKKIPKDYYITMRTLDKDEDGALTPFLITYYKATIQRNFELSFSSEGDPASVTLTFDTLEDKEGRILDMVELPEDAE